MVGLEEDFTLSSSEMKSLSTREINEFHIFTNKINFQESVFTMIAPKIFGFTYTKKAVTCLLFSGSRKKLPDGGTIRGDINVLLLGDPSTAKSQFLKFVEKAAPISIYTSGKGSSAAGLTASIIRDSKTSEFYLEGGAMVLCYIYIYSLIKYNFSSYKYVIYIYLIFYYYFRLLQMVELYV